MRVAHFPGEPPPRPIMPVCRYRPEPEFLRPRSGSAAENSGFYGPREKAVAPCRRKPDRRLPVLPGIQSDGRGPFQGCFMNGNDVPVNHKKIAKNPVWTSARIPTQEKIAPAGPSGLPCPFTPGSENQKGGCAKAIVRLRGRPLKRQHGSETAAPKGWPPDAMAPAEAPGSFFHSDFGRSRKQTFSIIFPDFFALIQAYTPDSGPRVTREGMPKSGRRLFP